VDDKDAVVLAKTSDGWKILNALYMSVAEE
jgi:hypothetical protein